MIIDEKRINVNIIQLINLYGKENYSSTAHINRDSVLTYGELISKSDSLSCYLIEKYGEDKTPIIVFGHKQHEMLICFLACVKAGHPYIPVDSSLPFERVRDIISNSRSKLIFNIEGMKEIFENISYINIFQIDEIEKKYKGQVPDDKFMVKENDTYYIIYTSGSTGNPKGVQITRASLESFINWGKDVAKLEEKQQYVFMNQAPFSFDLSVMDLYLSLSTGSTLFSIDKAMIANTKELFQFLETSNVSVWVSTPSFAEMCLSDSKFNKELLPNLKVFLFCGETLSNTCVSRLMERFEQAQIVNMYGPTEATVAITAITVNDEVNKFSPLPVGKVKPGCEVKIIDKLGKIIDDGEKGEIIIIGDSVSTGYYENEELTQKVFYMVNNDGKSQRCYHTGDEGYIKNQLLFYVGRIDFQVKLNGYRIELEDIENNLRKVSLIKNCVVSPVLKEGKIQYLAAFVVLKNKLEEKEFSVILKIKEELKKFLPSYMIPRKFVIKETLPMTQNGKVNRKELLEDLQ